MSLSTQTLPGGWPIVNARTSLEELALAVSRVPTLEPPDASSPTLENPAIARCSRAYTLALKIAIERGKDQVARATDAQRAYREAMPPLSGHQNISDFIACVAHAMLIDTISGPDGTRLLYAAQVAHTTMKMPPIKRVKSHKSSHLAAPKTKKT